ADFFPGPFEIRPAGMDDANLRITIACPFLIPESLGDGVGERGGRSDTFRPAEAGLDGPFVLIDREGTHGKPADHKASEESDNAADEYQARIFHWRKSSLRSGGDVGILASYRAEQQRRYSCSDHRPHRSYVCLAWPRPAAMSTAPLKRG